MTFGSNAPGKPLVAAEMRNLISLRVNILANSTKISFYLRMQAELTSVLR